MVAVCYTWFVMIFFGGIQPARDPWKVHSQFASQVRTQYREQPILGYEMSFSAGYGLGPDYWNFHENQSPEEELIAELVDKQSVLIVAPEDKEEELAKYGTLSPVMTTSHELKQQWNGRRTLPKCWRLTPFPDLQLADQQDETDTF